MIRFVSETVTGGTWERGNTNVNLFRLTPNGADQVDNAEAHIRPHLPKELREVFFTDGDRTLSFIEGNKGDQMKRVEGAIRSLLGLGVVEDALSHIRKVSSDLNQKIKKDTGSQDELKTVSKRLTTLQEGIPGLEAQLKIAKEAHLKLEDLEQEADNKLSAALRQGNKEDLEIQGKEAAKNQKYAEIDVQKAALDHANLFKSEILGKQLLADKFKSAKAILDRLHEQGKLPLETIPVLEDRLCQPECICGESLDPNDSDGEKRREKIQNLINDSRDSDEIQQKVTALYYSAQDLLKPVEGLTWKDEYGDVFACRQRASTRCQKYGEEERAIDAKIGELPDVDIQQLRSTRNQYRSQSEEERDRGIRLSSQLDAKLREAKTAETEREKLLQKDEKGMKFISELEVAKDLQDILTNALETMKTRELEQVSQHMNSLFLEMIGADADQGAIITSASITPDFRIIVFGRHDHPLDPSQDLNGASRRALTIAFILALTKVSEVEAPNVIDTPLGMMSGYVKQAVLQLASSQSSQLILFLTHSEINGCEDILDERAGRVFTMTNPAHYPKILVNDPSISDARVVLCNCNHRSHCKICERRETVNLDANLIGGGGVDE